MSTTKLWRDHGHNLRLMAALSMAMAATSAGAAEVRPTGFETVPPEEAPQIDRLSEIIVDLQDNRARHDASQEGRLLRGVHAKSHGCVRADFTVNSDLAEEDRVGLLAQAGRTYQAWIRFSNAAALRQDDLQAGADMKRTNGSRGMALKVLDVEGEMLDLDGGRRNQDFLMINTPEFAFADARSYLRLNEVLLLSPKGDIADPFFLPLQLAKEGKPPPQGNDPKWGDLWAGFGPADLATTASSLKVIGKIKGSAVANPLQTTYFGAAPFMFGPDRAMKVSVAPCAAVEQPVLEITDKSPPENYLRDALAATMRGSERICFDFRIQTRTRAEVKESKEIEDATTLWGEDEVAKYRPVARIDIPAPQATDTPEGMEQCERLAFTPWHALAAHQPIGGINRLRQKVYESSAQHRGADGN
jgi:hypothetical protein